MENSYPEAITVILSEDEIVWLQAMCDSTAIGIANGIRSVAVEHGSYSVEDAISLRHKLRVAQMEAFGKHHSR